MPPSTVWIPSTMFSRAVFGAAFALGSLAISGCVPEPGFTVNTTQDLNDDNVGDGVCAARSGLCSLRAAVQEASAGPPGASYEIRLGSPGTYVVSSNLEPGDGIVFDSPGRLIEIEGCCLNATSSIIEAQGNTRLLTLLGGGTVLRRVTLRNGRGPDPGAPGLPYGGAIHVAGPGTRLEVDDSILEDNDAGAQGKGGAIFVADDANTQLIVSDSIVRNNVASVAGVGGAGGIHSRGATFISNTLFQWNEGNGGALRIEEATGLGGTVSHEVLRSTFRQNFSPNSGGGAGIRVDVGSNTLFVSLSTFSDNSTTGGSGAAITAFSGDVHVVSSTFTDNTAAADHHALVAAGTSQVTLENTVIDANPNPFDSDGEVHCTSDASLVLNGFNFVDGMSPTCEYVDTAPGDGDTVGSSNSLDADLDFYDETPIGHHAPHPGSPLIDHGPAGCSSPDQIGNTRPVGASCDTGAIEVQ